MIVMFMNIYTTGYKIYKTGNELSVYIVRGINEITSRIYRKTCNRFQRAYGAELFLSYLCQFFVEAISCTYFA